MGVLMETARQPSSDWIVAVFSGPTSSENLTTTLVGWSRWRGYDPRTFTLWYEGGGKALVLRGFDERLLADFLAYARSQCIPPLISGTPSQRLLTPSLPERQDTAPQPPAPPTLPLPTDSSPLLQGVLQVITERGTFVSPVERWLLQVLETTSLRETDILWSLVVVNNPDLQPGLVALASTPSLREQGVKLLGVPEDKLVGAMKDWLRSTDGDATPPSDGGSENLELTALRRAVEGRVRYWTGVSARLKHHVRGEGRMTAAVVLDENDGKVTWVFPRSPSPMVRAVSSLVLHAYEVALSSSTGSPSSVLATATYASRIAKTVGIHLQWYVVTAEKQSEVVPSSEVVSPTDLSVVTGLLARFGGHPAYLEARPEVPVPPRTEVSAPKLATGATKPSKAASPKKVRSKKK